VATEREVLMESFSAFRVTKVKRRRAGAGRKGKVVFEAGPLAHIGLNDPHATREKATAATTNEMHRSAISASFGSSREGSTGWTPSTKGV
jgi:hypothetical protein